MGGKNVIMVMDDADLELAVEGCLWGGFGTTGQRCTAASRVVVHEKVYQTFRRAVRRARAERCASATASIRRRRWGRRSARASCETVMKYVEIGKKEGATLACGGHALTDGRVRARATSTSRRSSPT